MSDIVIKSVAEYVHLVCEKNKDIKAILKKNKLNKKNAITININILKYAEITFIYFFFCKIKFCDKI